MLVRKTPRFRSLMRRSRAPIIALLFYTIIITASYEVGGRGFTLPTAIPALIGTVLSILLGFRTNSAYDRWWEARKIWGAIVNDSRTFARQVLTLFADEDNAARNSTTRALQKELVYRQAGWCYALAAALRRQDPLADLGPFVAAPELEQLRTEQNVPNALLQIQAQRIQDARADGTIDGFAQVRIDDTLTHLCDSMGQCERIKNTVFPTTYSYLVGLMVWLFFALVPLGLVQHLGWLTIPASLVIGSMFEFVEVISSYLQNPFENAASDTPMTALSRTIEINLRQQLGETELPPATEPVDGVLM